MEHFNVFKLMIVRLGTSNVPQIYGKPKSPEVCFFMPLMLTNKGAKAKPVVVEYNLTELHSY